METKRWVQLPNSSGITIKEVIRLDGRDKAGITNGTKETFSFWVDNGRRLEKFNDDFPM